MLVGGASVALSLPFTQCVVPEGITGPVAIYVTNDTQPINNNARDKFIGNIVAGPTMAFLDNSPEAIGALATSGSDDTSSSSDSGSDSSSSSSSCHCRCRCRTLMQTSARRGRAGATGSEISM